MVRIFMLCMAVLVLLPSSFMAFQLELPAYKVAVVREGDLWIVDGGVETKITSSGKVFGPKWSHDGRWVLYQESGPSEHSQKEVEYNIWAYHLPTAEKRKIFYNGFNPQWAPNRNMIAYKDEGVLDLSNLDRFYNVALGVFGYTWLPDGSGFLMSSQSSLEPDGWTDVKFYKKKVDFTQLNQLDLQSNLEHFFTLPKEVGVGDTKVLSIHTSEFQFSPSGKWISFIVSPTASWSMDSNMLCVLAEDGKKFEVLGEMITGVGEPKWAPSSDTIAYIEGGGRIVFGFKNKKLKVKEMPASGMYTPKDYAELDFTWISDDALVTSRVEEREWSNDFKDHPLPSLYLIDLNSNKQQKITNPPTGYGDYNPKYVSQLNKLVWFRKESLVDGKKTLWISEPDGSKASMWMENVDEIVFYE
ncbi:hypothetical protein LCL95_01230 [Bacillus timonensis]|nr:hypothetical protein [Bacillus timonensis]